MYKIFHIIYIYILQNETKLGQLTRPSVLDNAHIHNKHMWFYKLYANLNYGLEHIK